MSETSVELVRQSFEAWDRNDWDALREFYDPMIEVVAPRGWPEMGIIKGWEDVRTQFARSKDSWEEEHVEIDQIEELQPGVVLAQIRWVTRGKESKIAFERPVSTLFRLRERIVRIEYYFDRADALKAAGLSE